LRERVTVAVRDSVCVRERGREGETERERGREGGREGEREREGELKSVCTCERAYVIAVRIHAL